MKNERITENIFRDLIRELGYYDDENLMVEEQKSAKSKINKRLEKASKSGNGAGYPEFLISHRHNKNLIVVECKANIVDHEKAKKEVEHYANFLKNEFNVIGIAMSGDLNNYLIDTYIFGEENKNLKLDKIQNFKYYSEIIDNKLNKSDSNVEINLKSKAIELNEYLRDKIKILEVQRPTLIGMFLIALDNELFRNQLENYTEIEELVEDTISSARRTLKKAKVLDNKIDTMINELSMIKNNTFILKGEIDINNPQKNGLYYLLTELKNNVYNYIKSDFKMDVIGEFYTNFLKYVSGDGKGLGIVLTPFHITDLFCELAQIEKDDVIYDPCCGTGGFLVSAMLYMLEKTNDEKERNKIKKENLIGVESMQQMYTLAICNMILRGDGKTNIIHGDCFDVKLPKKPTVGFINPPYSQKNESELQFILNMLNSLSKGGRGIAIVPVSAAIGNNKIDVEFKRQILEKHTLKGVFSLNDEIFYPTGAPAVIMVFEAKTSHKYNNKVYFADIKDDGFIKHKTLGRYDYNNTWNIKKSEIVDNFLNKSISSNSLSASVTYKDEWLYENFVQTPLEKFMNENDFKKEVFDYSVFLLTNNLNDNVSNSSVISDEILLSEKKFKKVKVNDFFSKISYGKHYRLDLLDKGTVPYVTTQSHNNGIAKYTVIDEMFNAGKWTVATDGAKTGYISYQDRSFACSHIVAVLETRYCVPNIYIGLFISAILKKESYRYSYGRKMKEIRFKDTYIYLPINDQDEYDFEFMENYIKSLPYSVNLKNKI